MSQSALQHNRRGTSRREQAERTACQTNVRTKSSLSRRESQPNSRDCDAASSFRVDLQCREMTMCHWAVWLRGINRLMQMQRKHARSVSHETQRHLAGWLDLDDLLIAVHIKLAGPIGPDGQRKHIS